MTLFLRGFTIVCLTAMNVRFISRGAYAWAFLTGFGISAVWWLNTGKASHDQRAVSLLAYATGAATGTVVGAWIGGWL